MMLTETEMKTKICPQLPVDYVEVEQAVTSSPMNYRVERFALCQGSACAMWRWSSLSSIDDQTGFCGLAGKPPLSTGIR